MNVFVGWKSEAHSTNATINRTAVWAKAAERAAHSTNATGTN
jgi:hypothetical protein